MQWCSLILRFHVLSFAPIYKKLVALVSLYRPDLDYKYVNTLTVKLAMRHNRNVTTPVLAKKFSSLCPLSPLFSICLKIKTLIYDFIRYNKLI